MTQYIEYKGKEYLKLPGGVKQVKELADIRSYVSEFLSQKEDLIRKAYRKKIRMPGPVAKQQYGLDIPTGWEVEILPSAAGELPRVNLITGDLWTETPEGTYVPPSVGGRYQRSEYTLEQLSALPPNLMPEHLREDLVAFAKWRRAQPGYPYIQVEGILGQPETWKSYPTRETSLYGIPPELLPEEWRYETAEQRMAKVGLLPESVIPSLAEVLEQIPEELRTQPVTEDVIAQLEPLAPDWDFPRNMTWAGLAGWIAQEEAKRQQEDAERQRLQEEGQRAISAVFPKEEVDEIIAWLGGKGAEAETDDFVTYDMVIENRFNEFLDLIWKVGRTPETEGLLKAMGATPQDIDQILGSPVSPTGTITKVTFEVSEKPLWQKVLDWAFYPFTAAGTMFAQMWSPHKPVSLTPEGFEYEPFGPQFDVGYGKFAHEEMANTALQTIMQNIEGMGIPQSQWDNFLVGAKTFFDFWIANNMARMPGGAIFEEYEKLPWYKQMAAEAPVYFALAGVPGANAIRTRLATRAAQGGLAGRAAQVGKVAITPIAGVETVLGYPIRKISEAVFTRLNQAAIKRVLGRLATQQGISIPGATQETLINTYRQAFNLHLERELAAWMQKSGVQLSDKMVNRVVQYLVGHVKPEWAARRMLNALGKQTITPTLIENVANTAAREAVRGLPAILDDILKTEPVKPPPVTPVVKAGVLTTIPPQRDIINAALQPNWQKSLLQFIGKLPGGERIVKAIDPRELISRDAKTITDIVNQQIIGWQEIIRMGQSVKAIKLGELQAITTDPVKMFGFKKSAYSRMMANRIQPEFKGTLEAGTLEHVFTHPLAYNWDGFKKGFKYVAAVQRINKEALNLLKAEGIAPENVTEDWWIHRVVQGKYDPDGALIEIRGRAGMRGRLAARKAYEMHRKAPTMYEGMVWGIKYAENPELSITTYLDEVFSKIAGERFYQGADEALKAIGKAGKSPLEVLSDKYPDIAKRAEITAREMGYAEKALGVIKSALRGYQPSAQTLRAIERHFPELSKRLRALTTKNVETENDLRDALKNTKRTIDNLQRIVEKQKAAIEKGKITKSEAIAQARKQIEQAFAESLKVIPDEVKLREAFRLMHYEDRLAFRDTITTQQAEIEQMLYEQEGQLQGLQEFLRTDPIATYRGHVGKRVVSLTSILRQGQIPETVTVKMARLLLMGAEPKIIAKGRVPRAYIMDELADHFGISEPELEDALVNIWEVKQTVEDLKMLTRIAKDRLDSIKQMLRILDGVEHPENIPIPEQQPVVQPEVTPEEKAIKGLQEPGMPEAGIQTDIFGHATPVTPPGKGEVKNISMDDYAKLVEHWRKSGIPEQDMPMAIRPQVEGIPELEKPAEVKQVSYDVPEPMSKEQRLSELRVLKAEAEALLSGKKVAWYQARMARARKMEEVKQPPIGGGFLMQSHFAGKIYDQEFIDAVNRFFGHDPGSNTLKFISDVAGIMRITKASLDFSFMAIQGMPSFGLAASYMATNPKIGVKMMAAWFKGLFYPVRGALQPEWLHAYLAKNSKAALERISFGGSSQAIDYFEALRTGGGLAGLAAKGMAKIPLRPYHRAELVFYGAGEIVRNEFWNILKDEAIKTGNEYNLARFLDRLTGIISTESMGVPITLRQLESAWVWFAPRYTRACLTLLSHTFRGGFTGAKARRALGAMIAAGIAMYVGIVYAKSKLEGKDDEEAWNSVLGGFGVYHDPITDTWEWKPSAQFMTLRIGNYNMGIGGFWYGLVRLAGNILATINRVGDRELVDFFKILKDGKVNRDNPLVYWWYTRASPFTGFMLEAGGSLLKSIAGLELFSGSDFLGYPLETPWDYAHYILTRFEPIWAEQGLNWMIQGMAREQEIPEGIARFLLPVTELFGLRTFPMGAWVEFYDKANEYINRLPADLLDDYYSEDELPKILEAQKQGKLRWEHLPEALQNKLLEMYPDLKGIREEAIEDSSLRNSEEWKQWEAATDKYRTEYYEQGDNLVDRLLKGEIDTREFRERWGEAGQNYGIALDTLKDQGFYKVIYDYFEKKRQEGTKYDWDLDLALQEYETAIFSEYLDEKGDFDWDARDKAIADYIEKWGEDVYMMIRQMYSDKKKQEGLNPILIRLADDKDKLGRDYWQLPYKPIYEMDPGDEIEGNIPAEYYTLWKEYQALDTDAEREAFLKKHPDLAKDWRAEYRKSHPEEDAMLALWGYSGKLQTLEAYNLVEKWSQELGIPMSQMGLGLPPRNLISSYFEHNEIVTETSGNSIESKLYLLTEGNQYLDWLLEQGIRKDDLSGESVGILQLRVDYKDLFAQYDAYGDRLSEMYIEDDGERGEARQKLLFGPDGKLTDFGKAYYTKEAFSQGYSEENWDKFVAYNELPDYGDYRERYLLKPENEGFYKEWLTAGEGHIQIEPEDVSPVARDEIYTQFYDLFQAWGNTAGMTRNEVEALHKKLLAVEIGGMAFAEARYRVEAYDKGIPEDLIDDYAEWYTSEDLQKPDNWKYDFWFEDDRWIKEHPEFEKAMFDKGIWTELRELKDIPSREVEDLYKQYLDISGDDASYERLLFRYNNPELDEWLVDSGRVSESMRDKDFEPKPVLTQKQQLLVDKYDALPTGNERLYLRCQSEWLDTYLVETRGYKKCYGTYRCGFGERPEEVEGWREWAEAEAIRRRIEELMP